ncbi:hypothetical protein ACFL3C_02800 [Patescibacteria group bacterium]
MSKKIQQLGFWLFNTGVMMLLTTSTVFAQGSKPAETKAPSIPDISTLPGPQGGKDVDVSQVGGYLQEQFLPRVAVTVVTLAVGSSVLFVIIGAIMMLTAYGNEEKVGNAKKTIMLALLGLVISLLSYVIVQLVFFTGYQITEIR